MIKYILIIILLGLVGFYYYKINNNPTSNYSTKKEVPMNKINEEQALQIAYNTEIGSQFKNNPTRANVKLYNNIYTVDFPVIWNGQHGYSVQIQIDSQDGKVLSVDEKQLVK